MVDKEQPEENKCIEIEDKTEKISAFKENTRKIRELADLALPLGKITSKISQLPTNNIKKYRLNLTEFGISEGYCLEYNREVDQKEFEMLLCNLFDIHVEHHDDEEELEDDVMVFKSLEEVIDYLKNKQNKEE